MASHPDNIFQQPDAAVVDQAMALITTGRFGTAEMLLRKAIDQDASNHRAINLLGQLACHFKQFEMAEHLSAEALRFSPREPAYHVTRGRSYRGLGRHVEAAESFRRALACDANQPDAWVLLGLSAKAQGDLGAASEAYRKALALRPDYAEAKVNLANVLRELGDIAAAASLYEAAAAAAPHLPEAQSALAASLFVQGRDQEALEQYRRVLAIDPARPGLQFVKGVLAQLGGGSDEAIEAYTRAVEQRPDHADAWVNLGLALADAGHAADSLDAYRKALEVGPDHVEAHINFGLGLASFGAIQSAVALLRRAAELKPNWGDTVVLSNLGAMLVLDGRLNEAEAVLRRALEQEPESIRVLTNLGAALRVPGRQRESVAMLRRAVALDPNHIVSHSNLLLSMLYADGVSGAEIVTAAHDFGRHLTPVQTQAIPLEAAADRRLRIGYVSPDLRRHSVAYFLEPVMEHHDRQRWEIFCYQLQAQEDEVSERLRKLSDGWFNAAGLAAERLAERIRADGIDILIDLAGHTGQHRLPVFAQRPAPVQMTWLGYPSTVGLPAIQYRITDWQVDPPGYERFNTETPLRLPHSYFCYRPGPAPEVGSLPAGAAGPLTFGSFNNLSKLSEQVLQLWGRVLAAVPDSRLIIKNRMLAEAGNREHVQQAFAALGIAAERLELMTWAEQTDSHLDVYNRIDIGLDSYPYNGATTTCEALWMGVPIVSLCGETHASRMGLSILGAAGLAELVADSDAGFVALAVALANDRVRLADLRAGLRERLRSSPLMDAPAYTQALEALYRQAWQACSGTPVVPVTAGSGEHDASTPMSYAS